MIRTPRNFILIEHATTVGFLLGWGMMVFAVGMMAGELIRAVTPFSSMPLWLAGGWISISFACGFFFSVLQRFLIATRKRNTPC